MMGPKSRHQPNADAQQHQQATAPPANDRARLNRQQLIEQQQINRERRAQDEADAMRAAERVARSKAQYNHVPSRLGATQTTAATNAAMGFGGGSADAGGGAAAANNYQLQSNNRGGGDEDVQITVFVRECEPDGGVFSGMESDLLAGISGGAANNNHSNVRQHQPQQQAAPRVQQQQQQQQQPHQYSAASQRALIAQRENRQAAAGAGNTHRPQGDGGRKLGSVPDYLRQRKAELQAEKDAAAQAVEEERERNRHPPGHRLVSDEERAAVLAKLESRKLELERDLARLPMRFDTMAVQRRRADIEKEMAEVEEGHRRFSVRKQLYVPI